MITITKRMRFCCSHRLYNPAWSETDNADIFGPCSNLHGHNYVIEVTVKGTVDNLSGMIINLNTLSCIIKKEIIDWVDHKNLNEDIEIFKNKIPTIENLAEAFWNKLNAVLPDNILQKVTLYETDDNRAEYSKD